MNTNEAGPALDRAFLNFIESHRRGAVVTELSAALKQASAATQETGKASKVYLTISLAPVSRGSIGTLLLTTEVDTKLPTPEKQGSIFYTDDDFNLVREDPRQQKLALREVTETQTQQLKEVS